MTKRKIFEKVQNFKSLKMNKNILFLVLKDKKVTYKYNFIQIANIYSRNTLNNFFPKQ